MFLDMKTAELVLQLGSHVEMVFKATNLQRLSQEDNCVDWSDRKESKRPHWETGNWRSGQWLERGGISDGCLGIQKAESHQTGEQLHLMLQRGHPGIETRNEQLRVLDKLYVSSFVVLWELKWEYYEFWRVSEREERREIKTRPEYSLKK